MGVGEGAGMMVQTTTMTGDVEKSPHCHRMLHRVDHLDLHLPPRLHGAPTREGAPLGLPLGIQSCRHGTCEAQAST